MKRIALAFGTMALGLSSAVYAQVPAPQQENINQGGSVNQTQPVNPNGAALPAAQQTSAVGFATGGTVPPPAPVPVQTSVTRSYSRGYSLYGGPEETRSRYPERRGTQSPHFSPLYTLPGVADDITMEDQAREARRNAAVEFGMFRNQFTGSTQFWMDHDRTRLAKVRYAMDEPMFRSVHPDYDWGDGGYMYNTAASVGGPQFPGSSNRVIVSPPQGAPTVRTDQVVRTDRAAVVPVKTVQPVPTHQKTSDSAPLVASDRGE